jgi:peptide deformylase
MLTVLYYPDKFLSTKCEPVTEFGVDLMSTVQQMITTMISSGGIGLAANQVGMTKQIFVMELADTYQEFINPEIVSYSGELYLNEGCLSFPGVRASIKRYESVKIKAKTFMGNDIEMDLSGRDAICAQHEIDHLNGVTFLDHLGIVKKAMLSKKISKIKKMAKKVGN